MEKILKLYTFVDGIKDTPFPNKTEQIVIGDFKYDANGRMGGVPTIEATVKHRLCLDKLWTDKVYASFDGQKFYVKDTPSSSKNNEDERYEHSVTLKSEREVLNHTYFIDAVQGDSTIDGVVSNSLKVQFMGDITQFVARLNASMSYSKIDYTAVIDDGITSESQLVSFEDKYILEALQEIYNVYKLPYYFVGKTIHVGYEQNAIPTVMKYGIDGALLSVSKENANYNLVNRITGAGSSDNIPYYYPNKTPKGEVSINVYSGNQGLTQSDLSLTDAVKFAEKVGSTDKCIYSKKSGENVVVINSYEFYNSSTFVDYEANSEISIPVRKEGSAYKSTATFLVNVTILHDASITVNTAFMPINFSFGALSSPSFTIKGYGEEDTQYKVLNNGDKVAAGDYTIKVVFKVSYTGIVSDSVTSAKFYFEASFPSSYYEYWDLNGKEVTLEEIGISLNGSPKLVVGDYFTQNVGKQIPYCTELMPPIYRETEGEQRFYNALNDTYKKPDSEEYYTFENVYSDGNPMEGKVTAEDIKPSIKGMTNTEGLRIDMFTEFAYDENDNDEVDENGDYVHPYFFGKFRKFNGEYGFNLFNHASESGNMEFSFTSGMCGSCTFEVGAGDETQKNLVQVDNSGNLLRDENGNVRCGRDGLQKETPQDRQNDTVNYEVWVALKKDDTTYTNVMPNVSKKLKPKAGDTFVILNINMPDSYIYKAENDLKEYLIQYMAENNSEKFNFSIKFSRIFFAEHPDILEQLNENSRLIVEYNKVQYTFYVDNFTYTMSADSPLPEIEVNLVDTLSIGQNSLQTMLDGVKQDVLSNIGSGDILSQGNKYFLRKDVADSAREKITFEKRIDVGNFSSGVLGSGGSVYVDSTGNSYAEFDYLSIRKKALFTEITVQELKHIGGSLVISPASMIISKVENLSEGYKCYFTNKDDDGKTIYNEFEVGDQARCQTFNLEKQDKGKIGNRYWWRLVTSVGSDYIVLSKTDADNGSGIPQEGDEVAQLGNRNDATRQNAQIYSAYGADAPSRKMYQGINSYSLEDKIIKTEYFDASTGRFKEITYGDAYIGAKDESTYVKYDQEKGVEVDGVVKIKQGSSGAANLTDLPDEIYQAVKIGGENLLLNTGFVGNYEVLKLDNSTKLESDTEMYNTTLDKWNGEAVLQKDSDSLSGVSATISSPLSQVVILIQGENYVISYKAKGSLINIKCGGNAITQDLTPEYKRYYHVFTNNSGNTFEMSGNCTVCEIKLERGTIPTDWCPSVMDASVIKDKFKDLWYLQDAMKGSTSILGGLILSSMIQLGKYTDGVMEKVNAGISGIYNDDTDVAIWSGGTFEQAVETVQKLLNEENPTDEEWKSLAKFVATHGGDIFLRGYIYALGGVFRGRVETSINGNRIVIDPSNSSLIMYNSDGKVCLNMSFRESGERIFAGINVIEYEGDTPSFSASLSGRILTFSNSIEGYSGLFAPDRITFQSGREEIFNIHTSKDYNDGSNFINIYAPKWNTNSQGLAGNVYVDENGFLKVTK